jgi:hypothetical protein
LRRRAKQLDQGKRRRGLNQHCAADDGHQRNQKILAARLDDIVDQIFGGAGQHKAGRAINKNQHQACREKIPPRPYQLAQFPVDMGRLEFRARLVIGVVSSHYRLYRTVSWNPAAGNSVNAGVVGFVCLIIPAIV